MENDSPTHAQAIPVLRTFGVGDTGIKAIELMMADGLMSDRFVAVNSDAESLEKSAAGEKILLEDRRLRGLGSGGDPERGRQAAELKAEQFKALCEGVNVVFIVAGLGGGSGTGISPVVARIAKAAGALVLGFVTIPFDCEGDQRLFLAQHGLDDLKEIADGVICLPNQKVFNLIEQNTSAIDTFRIINRFLADGVQGVWRLLALKGLIQIHPEALLRLLHERHSECAFAVAQASGPDRAPRVVDKLLAHPLLDNGQALANSESVLISLTAGAQLTMAEVKSVMEQIKTQCHSAQVLMGAAIDERFDDRLAVTVITAQKLDPEPAPRTTQTLDTQLLERTHTAKPNSRFLPPAPALAPEKMQQMFARQNGGRSAQRRASLKMRQGQLPLEIVSKGRFDKSEPTIHKGEDLDVPTYIRRGVPLN
jgi:cell division protein FtsZ